MITHLFKLIWNQKKQNFLIMLELFFSYVALFIVFMLIIKNYTIYQEPSGFDPQQVWAIHFTTQQEDGQAAPSRDTIMTINQLVKGQVKAMPEVLNASYSSTNTPFSHSHISIKADYGPQTSTPNYYIVEDQYAAVLNLQLTAGRWFQAGDAVSAVRPIVINSLLREKFFPNEDPLNKIMRLVDKDYKVIGVVNGIKDNGDFSGAAQGVYVRADSNFYDRNNTMLIKVKPGTDTRFEARLFKLLAGLKKNTTIEITHLNEEKAIKNRKQLIPVFITSIIVVVFIINVAFGFLGVLWYRINQRKSEIGLRRAVGASSGNVSRQLVGEAIILASISLIAGSLLLIQFPLMNIFDQRTSTYFGAIGLSIACIYLLAILCSLYPSRQAADIYPAVALHED